MSIYEVTIPTSLSNGPAPILFTNVITETVFIDVRGRGFTEDEFENAYNGVNDNLLKHGIVLTPDEVDEAAVDDDKPEAIRAFFRQVREEIKDADSYIFTNTPTVPEPEDLYVREQGQECPHCASLQQRNELWRRQEETPAGSDEHIKLVIQEAMLELQPYLKRGYTSYVAETLSTAMLKVLGRWPGQRQ